MTVEPADVAGWGKFPNGTPTGDELALLERVIAAVVEHVEDNYIVAVVDEAYVLTDTQELAVILQSARLWKRRDTPEGLAGLGDGTVVRVTGLDKDVAMMLSKKIAFA